MVDLAYVKQQKRKKVIAIVSCISSVVLIAFIIISFLGKRVGSFTINLRSSDVKLSLATHSDFRDRTTYLKVDDILPLDCYCYQDFKDKETGELDFTLIDNENTTNADFVIKNPETGEIVSSPFFKYTFFVGNDGTSTAAFDMELKITLNERDPITGKYVDEILRVMLIEDGTWDTVYAKRSSDTNHYDPILDPDKEHLTDYEYICGDAEPEHRKKWAGLAEPFASDSLVFSETRTGLLAGENRRYTLLYWLEGDDPECKGEKPTGSKLRLGVEINAYAN